MSAGKQPDRSGPRFHFPAHLNLDADMLLALIDAYVEAGDQVVERQPFKGKQNGYELMHAGLAVACMLIVDAPSPNLRAGLARDALQFLLRNMGVSLADAMAMVHANELLAAEPAKGSA